MMKEGLAWRGGEVTYAEGQVSSAKAVFHEWKDAGKTRLLSPGRAFGR